MMQPRLSFSQESLWLVEQLEPATARHHISKAWTLRGPLDVEALRRSFHQVCRRHSALRTVFAERNGAAEARLLAAPPDLEEQDWRAGSAEERGRRLMEGIGRPFDLAAEAPVRMMLARISEEEHALLLVFHHIAVDGWSLGVFYAEVAECYRAFRRGEEPRLEEVKVQFHEHAARERERLDPAELDRLAGPWVERLKGAPQLSLPVRAAQERRGQAGGGLVAARIEQALAERVLALSRSFRTTANAVYLAVLQALLARYSGQSDFLMGIAYANRGEEGLERAIGLFVNTLMLRADLTGEPTFGQLLKRVSADVFDALEIGELPLAELVDRLQPQRVRGAGQAFNALFAYQSYGEGGLELEGVEIHEMALEITAPPVADLTVTIEPAGSEPAFTLWYSTQIFSEPMARRFAEHYVNLLASAVAAPGAPVQQMEILGVEERRRILELGTGPRHACGMTRVEEAFAARVEAGPERPALRSEGGVVTYAELDVRTNRLAHLMAARGLRPGGFVGVLGPRSAALVECWLAILKAGCAYVPLDPADPEGRLAAQLADCGAAALITLAPAPARLAGAVPLWIDLSACGEDLARQSAARLEAGPAAAEAACVMFSSGSTGRPKGAAVPHRGILRLLLDNGFAAYTAEDKWLFMAPPSFDASTLEVWGALLNGGCCTVLPAGIPSLAALAEAIRGERISVLWLTSSLFNAIIDDEPEMLRGVRLVMTGGEALSVPHVRKALRLLPQTRLLNGYGPTENTTFTTCWEIPRDFPERAGSVPIGRPIAGTRVYVLDPRRRLVPVGVAGELYASGEGVALGYEGLPELTAERFVPDPFTAEPGGRMYRTGDIVRWLDSGVLEFLGRSDDQVKIRGYRVEPGELEAALQAHAAVRQACVTVGEDAAAGRFLIAYYVVSRPVARAELREFLEARLPRFLLPRELVEVAAMPLLPSGKVDRGALAALWSSRRAAPEPAGLDVPRPGVEEQVAAIWRRLVGRKIISRSDDFFEIGGNSLAAVRLVTMLRKEMGARLQVADVFRWPVLSGLAAAVAKGDPRRREAYALQPSGHKTPVYTFSAGPRFRNLAGHFAAGRPVLALPEPGLEGLAHPCRCEDLAARYAEWLKAERPEGPWILTGWCLAGVLAFATARHLAGRGPGAVVLLDSPCPAARARRAALDRLRRSARRLAYHGRAILSGRHGGLVPYLRERIQTLNDLRALRSFGKRYERLAAGKAGDGGDFAFQDVVNHVASRYEPPEPLSWPVLLLRAAERADERDGGEDWGWRRYAPSLEVVWAEGDHGTIFEAPYVTASARMIGDWLDGIPELG